MQIPILLTLAAAVCPQKAPERANLEPFYVQAFGDRVRLDPEKAHEVLRAPLGTLLKVDEDRDGGVDGIYFVDNDPRHDAKYRPIVVKAIAPSGNFPAGWLNMANAVFAASWRGTGIVDRIVAHLDDDGDGDIDRMLVPTVFGIGAMHLVMVEDISDDNRLWYHRNYQYDVETGWWRSDWNGDEVFYFFVWEPSRRSWIPRAEAPFAFYDTDKDGFADEALRVEANGRNVFSFRWSFDIDRDANPYQPHDYDLSLTGLGPVEVPEAFTARARIGLFETDGYLPWGRARQWIREAGWKAVALTWDEADNNVDLQSPNRFGEGESHEGFRNERWEGVLNHPLESFPQVGGPSAGPFNRRTEVDLDYSGQMQLYYSPMDHRVHLYGAEYGVQRIDFNLDGKMDMEIRTGDRNRDGYFDTWEIDVNGDGAVDRSYGYQDRMSPESGVPYEPLPADAKSFYVQHRRQAIDENMLLVEAMRAILQAHEAHYRPDEAESFYKDRLRGWQPDQGLGKKMRASIDTERFYSDVVRERYFDRVLRLVARESDFRRQLLRVYGGGDYRQTRNLLASYFKLNLEPEHAGGVLLEVKNPSDIKLWRYSIVVDLKAEFPDKTVRQDGIDVWEAVSKLAPEPVPSQSDDLDGDGRADELVFVADLEPWEARSYRLSWRAGPASGPVQARAGVLPQQAWLDSGYARFHLHANGEIWFAGKRMSIIDNRGGEEAGPPDRVDAQILLLDTSDGRNASRLGPFELVRDGPLRAVVRCAGGSLLAVVYAYQPFSELRYSDRSRPLRLVLPGGETGIASGMNLRHKWDGDMGVAAVWPSEPRFALDPGGPGLRIQPGNETVRFWVTGYWRSGDRKPFWPSKFNWERSLERWSRVWSSPPVVAVTRQAP